MQHVAMHVQEIVINHSPLPRPVPHTSNHGLKQHPTCYDCCLTRMSLGTGAQNAPFHEKKKSSAAKSAALPWDDGWGRCAKGGKGGQGLGRRFGASRSPMHSAGAPAAACTRQGRKVAGPNPGTSSWRRQGAFPWSGAVAGRRGLKAKPSVPGSSCMRGPPRRCPEGGDLAGGGRARRHCQSAAPCAASVGKCLPTHPHPSTASTRHSSPWRSPTHATDAAGAAPGATGRSHWRVYGCAHRSQ